MMQLLELRLMPYTACMDTEKAIQLLRDEKIFPSENVLLDTAGPYYGVYREYVDALRNNGISVDWRYYKDGRAWLGKAVKGTRTVCWISLWEGFFRVSFYIATRLGAEFGKSTVKEEIRERATQQPPVGKLLPIVVEVTGRQQVADLMEIVAFKLNFK